jgi:hypothetical protein
MAFGSSASHASGAKQPAAQASTVAQLRAEPGFRLVAVVPLVATGTFNRAVAAAHGYRIVTRSGKEMAVPDRAGVKPLNKVTGNCGDSYVYASGTLATFQFYTGYDISADWPEGLQYEWVEDITGPPPYTNTLRQGPTDHLSFHWRYPASGWHDVPVDDSGKYKIEVETLSFVLLVSGEYCHSAGPTSSVTL